MWSGSFLRPRDPMLFAFAQKRLPSHPGGGALGYYDLVYTVGFTEPGAGPQMDDATACCGVDVSGARKAFAPSGSGFDLRTRCMMNEVMMSLLAGGAVGLLFAFLKLPIPAPPVLSGIMGIVGVYLGAQAYHWLLARLFS